MSAKLIKVEEISYPDFIQISPENRETIIFGDTDAWISVFYEKYSEDDPPDTFGIGVFRDYECLYEEHGLTKFSATLMVHDFAKRYLY